MHGSILGLLTATLLVVVATGEAGVLRTDTSRALVPLDEIISGGPPPDGIPAIDRPTFVGPADAAAWITLTGRRLTAVPHVDAFWFAWAAFNPATSLFGER